MNHWSNSHTQNLSGTAKMAERKTSKEAVAARGRELFENVISGQVQNRPRLDFLAIDIDSGDFESGPVRHEVVSRLLERHPEAQVFVRRIGVPFTYRLGGGLRTQATRSEQEGSNRK